MFASANNYLHGYCGDPYNYGWFGHLKQVVIIIVFSDFIEYFYHYLGHRYSTLWNIHKHHHIFYNPTPYSVIADEYIDQFIRTLPIIMLPMMMHTNIDLLFGVYSVLFYGYGVYLHLGYEIKYLSTHNTIFNTSYHHYYHHAYSNKNRPIYTGFFFKIWDYLFQTNANDYNTTKVTENTTNDTNNSTKNGTSNGISSSSSNGMKCLCIECRPSRSKEEFEKIKKPDYSVLLNMKWWLDTKMN